MQVYQATDVNKEDIDNFVKLINKKEKQFKKEYSNYQTFRYSSPDLYLDNGVEFNFTFYYSYQTKLWNLEYTIMNDTFYTDHKQGCNIFVDYNYFNSNTLKELLVKYINSKFTYDKHFNNIVNLDKYEEQELVKKVFPSNIKCPVCYDSLSGDFKTKCGHDLCVECYIKIKGKKKCPVCRACLCCGEQENCEDSDSD